MIAPTTTEPAELSTTVEFDKERQTIEKVLSKLAAPTVRLVLAIYADNIVF